MENFFCGDKMKKTFQEYEKNLETYVDFLDRVQQVKPNDEAMRLVTRGFYNCMAIAGYLSFPCDENFLPQTELCLKFIDIAERFMLLAGLNEEPDEMPWVLTAIKQNVIQFYSDNAQARDYKLNGLPEKEYEQKIVSGFSKIEQFKNYEFVDRQVKMPCGDQLDILAKEIVSQRPVIIEIKRSDKSGHKQLRSYATNYKNPILVNISVGGVKNPRSDILYYTINDLFADLHGQSEILNQQLKLF